jgi:hypothetical protein
MESDLLVKNVKEWTKQWLPYRWQIKLDMQKEGSKPDIEK